ncbi:MAG TPA: hypothetical protein VFK50_06520 [Sphingomicrobium sp.]|nr:hypothetical protein [Sphingomicrobium sp.]
MDGQTPARKPAATAMELPKFAKVPLNATIFVTLRGAGAWRGASGRLERARPTMAAQSQIGQGFFLARRNLVDLVHCHRNSRRNSPSEGRHARAKAAAKRFGKPDGTSATVTVILWQYRNVRASGDVMND